MLIRRILWWLGLLFFDIIDEDMTYLHLKPYRRQILFSCGPASLKTLFRYYGLSVPEKEIAKKAGTTKEDGTSPEGMIRAAKYFGFDVFSKENSTLDDLRYYINKKTPVVVDWFWDDDGHYGIVVGMDKKNIVLRDPSFWRIRKMPLEKFFRVWFDFPGNYPKKKDDLILRSMMVITPKK